MGDEIEGYKLVDFQPDIVTNAGRRVDRSRLVLEKGGQREVLVKGQIRNKSEKFLLLVSLLDREIFRTRVGESFTYRGKTFEIRDISSRGVSILDRELNKMTLVPVLSDLEKFQLKSSANPLGQQIPGPDSISPGPYKTGVKGR